MVAMRSKTLDNRYSLTSPLLLIFAPQWLPYGSVATVWVLTLCIHLRVFFVKFTSNNAKCVREGMSISALLLEFFSSELFFGNSIHHKIYIKTKWFLKELICAVLPLCYFRVENVWYYYQKYQGDFNAALLSISSESGLQLASNLRHHMR